MAAGHDKATCAVKLPAFTDDIEAIKAAISLSYLILVRLKLTGIWRTLSMTRSS